MPGKSTRIAAALSVAILAAQSISAQAVDDVAAIYRGAVDVYVRTGDITRAVAPLQTWKPQDFDRALEALIATKQAGPMRATAIFHLDIAAALVGFSAGTAKIHIDMGRVLLNKLRELRKGGLRVDDLTAVDSIWLTVAGSVFLSVKDVQRAQPYLREALELAPKSAHVRTVAGIAEEVDAEGFNPDDWQTLAQRERGQRERVIRLGRAERAYREALRLEPGYPIASIRLGRVLQLTGKLSEARVSLEKGVADARGPFQEYVGALYMGGLHVEQKDLAGARRWYERAIAIAPVSQPANVGLAHVELMSGRPDRAQALVREFTAASTTDTWWAYKDGSLDLPGLVWLRARARQ